MVASVSPLSSRVRSMAPSEAASSLMGLRDLFDFSPFSFFSGVSMVSVAMASSTGAAKSSASSAAPSWSDAASSSLLSLSQLGAGNSIALHGVPAKAFDVQG